MLRDLINRFRSSMTARMVAPRRSFSAPIRIWFDPDPHTSQTPESARSLALTGETIDLSRTGVGFSVNSIRIREKYLVGQERPMNVEIDLPAGRVQMQLIGVRYEKPDIHSTSEQFLVGARIGKMEAEHEAAYLDFIKYGNGRRRAGRPGLELNAD